jgi:hypothetical protein
MFEVRDCKDGGQFLMGTFPTQKQAIEFIANTTWLKNPVIFKQTVNGRHHEDLCNGESLADELRALAAIER